MRQVTHALLTRPPLSHKILHPEGIKIKCFVRLACVKHAASVHPEPGSNSQKKFHPFRLKLGFISEIHFTKGYIYFLDAVRVTKPKFYNEFIL